MDREEQYIASAVQHLLSLGKEEHAVWLATCVLEMKHRAPIPDFELIPEGRNILQLTLRGDSEAVAFFKAKNTSLKVHCGSEIGRSLRDAFDHVFPGEIIHISIALGPSIFDNRWREQLLARKEGEARNQNSYTKAAVEFQGMRFSSEPEVRIAQALDRRGVMYLPNALIRVGVPSARVNRFPDFLVSYQGKWGILEVDGSAYHTGRRSEDHERARLIEKHGGIQWFTSYSARQCMTDPDSVVAEFLEILGTK